MTININNVENSVFSGGGVKVIAYAGALKALEETGHLSQIKKVARGFRRCDYGFVHCIRL